MLTDKQSLALCAFVFIGFSFFGILDLLNNYAISGTLLLCFILVIVNLIINKSSGESEDDVQD
ncbi:hypothetical protein EJA19_10520 [Mangrovimonas spongiae]|uniref:Uncharacterized protein n=1 Tax=Mangrovimonas spongiae TaxID=2494697 RepID=A0A428JZ00_9FLAO|nr:hypothetical protein EJA19_10520 [Mangrovimonas spongiae]